MDGIEKVTDMNTVFVYSITSEKINDEIDVHSRLEYLSAFKKITFTIQKLLLFF